MTGDDPGASTALGDAPWYHALAIAASPAWLEENRAAILSDWPRVPLPTDLTHLNTSANLGRQVAALLDTEQAVPGIIAAPFYAPFAVLGKLVRKGGGSLAAADLTVTSWGRGGHGSPVMPGGGTIHERASYDMEEQQALAATAERLQMDITAVAELLGPPVDVQLNEVAILKGVPRSVYNMVIGGYQVLKKWLSYRDHEVIDRPITVAEAREAITIIRRLTALVLLYPALDAGYEATRASAFDWPASGSD